MIKNKLITTLVGIIYLIILTNFISAAQCSSIFDNFGIDCGSSNPNCEFGLDEPLKNITVYYTSKVETDLKKMRVLLCKNEECSGTNRLDSDEINAKKSGDKFYVSINCPKGINDICLSSEGIDRSGKYFIRTIIDPNSMNVQFTEEINIKKTLIILLNCPVQDFTNRDITCTYDVEDSETGQLISGYSVQATLEQGGNIKTLSPTLDSVGFNLDTSGSVLLTLEVSKEGYVKGIKEELIEIENPTNQENLLIDGKSIFDYGSDGITKGTHKLEIEVEKSGISLKTNRIEANLISPSGLESKLNFNKRDENTFDTSFNFEQVGQVYTLKGTIYPEDVLEDSIRFEYSIPIASEVTQPYKTSLLWISLGIIAGIIIFLIIIGIVIRKAIKK